MAAPALWLSHPLVFATIMPQPSDSRNRAQSATASNGQPHRSGPIGSPPHRARLFYSAFLSVYKDVLTATKKRRPEAARKAMGSLLSKTLDFLEHKVLRGPRASAKRSLDNVAAS